jgi:hypothetical protein
MMMRVKPDDVARHSDDDGQRRRRPPGGAGSFAVAERVCAVSFSSVAGATS